MPTFVSPPRPLPCYFFFAVSPLRGTSQYADLHLGQIRGASSLLGTSSNLFFNKGSGDVAWFAPFGWHNVLSARIRAGAVIGRRLSDTLLFVPPQERLYAGGPTSVRGFQQNELGDLVYTIARADNVKETKTQENVAADHSTSSKCSRI